MNDSVDIQTRDGLPSEMQILLSDLPRERWHAHPNFRRPTEQWMKAHQGFRQLGQIVQTDTEAFLSKDLDDQLYANRLSWFGALLVRNLHGHHTWEDRSFFPELESTDARFAKGLHMLEKDHDTLDDLIDTLTGQANRVVKLATLAPDDMPQEAAPFHQTATQLSRFLDRHLTDEEDLVVPIILHHKLRG